MGFEIEGEYRLNPITLKVGLSEVFAENDDTGEYLTNNTPLTFVGDVGYDVQSIDSTIGWRTRIADKSDRGEQQYVQNRRVCGPRYLLSLAPFARKAAERNLGPWRREPFR